MRGEKDGEGRVRACEGFNVAFLKKISHLTLKIGMSVHACL
jgi:hypothetical protein